MKTPTPTAAETGREPVTILYTNWRGETAVRRIIPQGRPLGMCGMISDPWHFGTFEPWHSEPQWLLRAHDVDKDERREFAMSGIKVWGKEAVEAALSPAPAGVEDAMRALEPFAKAAAGWDADENDGHQFHDGELVSPGEADLTVGHLRRAREACAALARPAPDTPAAPAGHVVVDVDLLREARSGLVAFTGDACAETVKRLDVVIINEPVYVPAQPAKTEG